jgi:hypothetical protein
LQGGNWFQQKKLGLGAIYSIVMPIPGEIGAYPSGNSIQVGGGSPIPITRQLCGNCGYIEEWLDSEVNLQYIKQGFLRQQESGAPKATNEVLLVFGIIIIMFLLGALAIGVFFLLPI